MGCLFMINMDPAAKLTLSPCGLPIWGPPYVVRVGRTCAALGHDGWAINQSSTITIAQSRQHLNSHTAESSNCNAFNLIVNFSSSALLTFRIPWGSMIVFLCLHYTPHNCEYCIILSLLMDTQIYISFNSLSCDSSVQLFSTALGKEV